MYFDRSLVHTTRSRTATDQGAELLIHAWTGWPAGVRAAMIAAQGNLMRAAACAGGGWAALAAGNVSQAIETARASIHAPGMGVLEAEALFAAGAFAAGFARLETLHAQGNAAASLALARRRLQMGDHEGAIGAANVLPLHAHAALIGARAALASNRTTHAWRLVEPFLEGVVCAPEPATAGAVAITGCAVLARWGDHLPLRRFVDHLLSAGDLPEDMMPAVARAAWIGGRAHSAWKRFGIGETPWGHAARLELAVLAGNPELASGLLNKAGAFGAPGAQALELLTGAAEAPTEAPDVFEAGHTIHVWRTHPHRWAPWIEGVRATSANVVLCDLARKQLPDPDILPDAVFDDGGLLGVVEPVPVKARRPRGQGTWIGPRLCEGVGIGHDWPDEETDVVRRALVMARNRKRAAVHIVDIDTALASAQEGRPCVVVAPPGDPFWAGPIPERVWPVMRVVRSNPMTGWAGVGHRVAEAACELGGKRCST